AQRCHTVDDPPPLTQAGLRALTRAGAATPLLLNDLLVRTNGSLIGYAQVKEGTGQLFVDPKHRLNGLAHGLLARAASISSAPPSWWAFGNVAAAAGLAASLGATAVRELLLMGRDLDRSAPSSPPPPGIAVRPFEPGSDDRAWVALNARVFADHPEQGRLTADDLAARMAEDWFDPAGFLVAIDSSGGPTDGTMLGFHWTKISPPGTDTGEVYVLGVSPDAAGRGLGRLLLEAGLDHLFDAGLSTVELYTEGDNVRARTLYERSGFTVVSRDVMYRIPAT
ncbi:MAG: mycothiol synthase, partial [Propionibacteriales bacterium]|nr:mycothiol synthase [Propionibacteriales bacterium]